MHIMLDTNAFRIPLHVGDPTEKALEILGVREEFYCLLQDLSTAGVSIGVRPTPNDGQHAASVRDVLVELGLSAKVNSPRKPNVPENLDREHAFEFARGIAWVVDEASLLKPSDAQSKQPYVIATKRPRMPHCFAHVIEVLQSVTGACVFVDGAKRSAEVLFCDQQFHEKMLDLIRLAATEPWRL